MMTHEGQIGPVKTYSQQQQFPNTSPDTGWFIITWDTCKYKNPGPAAPMNQPLWECTLGVCIFNTNLRLL